MERSARAPGYDLFKLLVALILFILFLLLFRNQVPQTAIPQPDAPTFTVLPPASTGLSTPTAEATIATSITSTGTVPINSTPTGTMSSNPSTTLRASPTSVSARSSPEATPTPMLSTATSTSLPAPPPTNTQVMTVTPLPPPSLTPVIESPATPTADAPPSADVCDAASARSRLRVGTSATILRRLNFRSSPGIRDNWILTNIPGTPVEVVGGPECVPHLWGAYLWWQIRLAEGQIGWSAEGSLHGTFYFMEPK